MEGLWSEGHGQYLCRDRTTGELVDSASVGGLLAAFAAVPTARAARIARTVERWAEKVTYVVPSHDPLDPRFEAQRYWRGPVWPVLTWLFAWAFARRGWAERSLMLRQEGLRQASDGSFAEYYEPFTGEPLGSMQQSWTAAAVLDWLG